MLFICYLWRLFCLQQEIMHSMLWASVCHRDKKAKKNEKKIHKNTHAEQTNWNEKLRARLNWSNKKKQNFFPHLWKKNNIFIYSSSWKVRLLIVIVSQVFFRFFFKFAVRDFPR